MQLKLEHLNKTYTTKRASVTAVKDISLDFPDNAIIGIIGKSGAGKSSLLRLASLLETPDQGEVYYDGVRVDHLPKKELNRRRLEIGMIFQNFNLFSSRTAGKNVAFPLELAGWNRRDIDERVHEMIALVGLEDREKSPIATLSGGQKQRVAIARALAPRNESHSGDDYAPDGSGARCLPICRCCRQRLRYRNGCGVGCFPFAQARNYPRVPFEYSS